MQPAAWMPLTSDSLTLPGTGLCSSSRKLFPFAQLREAPDPMLPPPESLLVPGRDKPDPQQPSQRQELCRWEINSATMSLPALSSCDLYISQESWGKAALLGSSMAQANGYGISPASLSGCSPQGIILSWACLSTLHSCCTTGGGNELCSFCRAVHHTVTDSPDTGSVLLAEPAGSGLGQEPLRDSTMYCLQGPGSMNANHFPYLWLSLRTPVVFSLWGRKESG